MSGDGPTKVAPPQVEPLDDIILGEDEQTVAPPPVEQRTPRRDSVAAAASGPVLGAGTEARKRNRMTLRIPDDEIVRPLTGNGGAPVGVGASDVAAHARRPEPLMPVAPVVPVAPLPPVAPIAPAGHVGADLDEDTLVVEREPELEPAPVAVPPALGIDRTYEQGWTPFQPSVAEVNHDPIFAERAPAPPSSEEIPVETDLSDAESTDSHHEEVTRPRLPAVFDAEEIRVEEAPVDPRGTDPGDVAEVEPEDLVSVESVPAPARPAVTATALMAAAPAAAPPPVARSGPTLAKEAPRPAVVAPAPPARGAARISVRRSNPQLVFGTPASTNLAPPPISEAAVSRKKTRPWWEELFNDDFIRTMAKLTEEQITREVDFIEESLGCEGGAMILDLACGTGRHAVKLAARGYQVVGFDLSLAMLARASDEAQEHGQKINFVQGDMREMTFEDAFDGIYSWNTSFGYFDEEKNNAVIARVHRALKKGGQFLLDVVNRDFIIRQAPSLAWFEGDGCICMDEMQIDFITSRMRVKRTLMMDDGRTKEIEYSIRIYGLHELGKMLHDNGFRVAEVSGKTATPGVFFGCESPRTLILAEKR